MSEVRQSINENLGAEATEESQAKLGELTERMKVLEVRYRAAELATPDEEPEERKEPDSQDRERLELRSKAHVGRIIESALRGRMPDGAEREIAEAEGVPVGEIPFGMFESAHEVRAQVEDRVVTGTPTLVGLNIQPIVPNVFAMSVAARLGINMPSVSSGTYVIPRLAADLTGGFAAEGADAAETAATFDSLSTTPHRIGGGFAVSMETLASVGLPDFEASLRANLTAVLSDALDKAVIRADGSANQPNGLVNQLDDPTDPTAVANWAAFVELVVDRIDGLYAEGPGNVIVAVNPDALKLALKTYRGTTTGTDVSAAAYLSGLAGGFFSNANLPVTAGNIATCVAHLNGRGFGAVMPTWGSMSVDDIYSDSRKATRHFTVSSLVGDVLLPKKEAYARMEVKVA